MAEENTESAASNKITNNCESTTDVHMDMFSDTWGFSLEDLYQIAVTFYKGAYVLWQCLVMLRRKYNASGTDTAAVYTKSKLRTRRK